MLDRYTREQIEWHFKNHEADRKLYAGQELDIIEADMCTNSSYLGSRNKVGSPTERKAIKLLELEEKGNWFKVVENTFIAFKFEPEYELMKKLYIEHKSIKKLLADGFPQSTFWYWRDRWLEYALMWAKEYKLM